MSNLKPYEKYNSNFPIPGVQQSSQGFRDNFLQIQKNFIITKNELENIQGKTIQLSGPINGSVNWSDNSILNLSTSLKDNLEFPGNQGIVVCIGNNSQRVNKNGIIRFNNETGRLETYEGNTWFNLTGKNEYLPITGGTINGNLTIDNLNSEVINCETITTEVIHSLRQSVFSFGRIGLINGTWNTIAEWNIDSISTEGKNCSYSITCAINHADLSRNWSIIFTGLQTWNFDSANVLSISNPTILQNSVGGNSPIAQMRTIEIGNKLQLQISAAETLSSTWEIVGNVTVMYGTNGNIPFQAFVI